MRNHYPLRPQLTHRILSESPVADIPADTLGYTGAILYLIADRRLHEAILSLSYLYQNVVMQPWPILMFYAEDMDDPASRSNFILHLYNALGKDEGAMRFIQRIEFVRVQWSLPLGISHDKEVVKPVFEHAWPGTSF